MQIGDGIGSGGSTSVFRVVRKEDGGSFNQDVTLTTDKDFSGQTLAIKQRPAGGGENDWTDYSPDGTPETITAPGSWVYTLPPGFEYRGDMSSGGSPNVDVHAHPVEIV